MGLMVDSLVRDLRDRLEKKTDGYSSDELRDIVTKVMEEAGGQLDEQFLFELGVVAAALDLRARSGNA